MIESKQFTVEKVAKAYGVPMELLGAMGESGHNGEVVANIVKRLNIPRAEADDGCLEILYHPEASDSLEWRGVVSGSAFIFSSRPEMARTLADSINKAIAIAVEKLLLKREGDNPFYVGK